MEKSIPTINHLAAHIKLLNSFPDKLKFLEGIGSKIIRSLGLSILGKTNYRFEPAGITLVYILSQSHLVLHTWPEYRFIHIDLFSCSDITKEGFEKAINTALGKHKTSSLKLQKMQNLIK